MFYDHGTYGDAQAVAFKLGSSGECHRIGATRDGYQDPVACADPNRLPGLSHRTPNIGHRGAQSGTVWHVNQILGLR
jgi:hypothetical protein